MRNYNLKVIRPGLFIKLLKLFVDYLNYALSHNCKNCSLKTLNAWMTEMVKPNNKTKFKIKWEYCFVPLDSNLYQDPNTNIFLIFVWLVDRRKLYWQYFWHLPVRNFILAWATPINMHWFSLLFVKMSEDVQLVYIDLITKRCV